MENELEIHVNRISNGVRGIIFNVTEIMRFVNGIVHACADIIILPIRVILGPRDDLRPP
jgi:hypothetical protein